MSEITKCKGRIYRVVISSYLSAHNSIELRKSARVLKRRSCTGCAKCGWIEETLLEHSDEKILNCLQDIQEEGIYRLCWKTSEESEGWEYPTYTNIENFYLVKMEE